VRRINKNNKGATLEYAENFNELRRNWYRINCEKLLAIKFKSGGCDYCGWDAHPEVLQFHHRNPSEKNRCISGSFLVSKTFDKIQEELNKCDLVCPNCHNWLHYKMTSREAH